MPDFNYVQSRLFMVALHAAAAVPVIEGVRRCVFAASDAINRVRSRLVEDEADVRAMASAPTEVRAWYQVQVTPAITGTLPTVVRGSASCVVFDDARISGRTGKRKADGAEPPEVGARVWLGFQPLDGRLSAVMLPGERHVFFCEFYAALACGGQVDWPPNSRVVALAIAGRALDGPVHPVVVTDRRGRVTRVEVLQHLHGVASCTHVLVARVPPSADTNDNAA